MKPIPSPWLVVFSLIWLVCHHVILKLSFFSRIPPKPTIRNSSINSWPINASVNAWRSTGSILCDLRTPLATTVTSLWKSPPIGITWLTLLITICPTTNLRLRTWLAIYFPKPQFSKRLPPATTDFFKPQKKVVPRPMNTSPSIRLTVFGTFPMSGSALPWAVHNATTTSTIHSP